MPHRSDEVPRPADGLPPDAALGAPPTRGLDPAPASAPAAAPAPPGGVSGLVARVRGAVDVLYREMIKFGVVGLLAFVIDLGLANILWHTVLADRVTTAKIISGIVATAFAWVGNRQWTFRHRRSRPAHHEVALFFGVNGIALGISALTLFISHYGLGFTSILADNIATIVGIGLGTLFRFWAYRRFVFAGEPL